MKKPVRKDRFFLYGHFDTLFFDFLRFLFLQAYFLADRNFGF